MIKNRSAINILKNSPSCLYNMAALKKSESDHEYRDKNVYEFIRTDNSSLNKLLSCYLNYSQMCFIK